LNFYRWFIGFLDDIESDGFVSTVISSGFEAFTYGFICFSAGLHHAANYSLTKLDKVATYGILKMSKRKDDPKNSYKSLQNRL